MDEKHYLRMRAKADEEYRKNLEALDRVWHMSNPDKSPPVPKEKAVESDSPRVRPTMRLFEESESDDAKPFQLSEAVKQEIVQMPDDADISQPIILKRLLDKYPELRPRVGTDQIKPQIAGTLSRMAKAGVLVRTKEPYGSEPAIFRKLFPLDQLHSKLA